MASYMPILVESVTWVKIQIDDQEVERVEVVVTHGPVSSEVPIVYCYSLALMGKRIPGYIAGEGGARGVCSIRQPRYWVKTSGRNGDMASGISPALTYRHSQCFASFLTHFPDLPLCCFFAMVSHYLLPPYYSFLLCI